MGQTQIKLPKPTTSRIMDPSDSNPTTPRVSLLTKRDLANAPGADPVALAQSFLPLVYGTAAALLPERPADVPGIVAAVFRIFWVQWRRLPKRTVIPSWLVRTTWFIARQERRRLGLPPGRSSRRPAQPGAVGGA